MRSVEQQGNAVYPIGEGDAQPVPALAASPPCFLPGSSMIEEADLDAAEGSCAAPKEAAVFRSVISMRGAVLAPASNSAVLHPGMEAPTDILVLPASVVLPRGSMFSMRGELMHAFISYRVVTEGASPFREPHGHRAQLRPHVLMAAQVQRATVSPGWSPRRSRPCRWTPITKNCICRSTDGVPGQNFFKSRCHFVLSMPRYTSNTQTLCRSAPPPLCKQISRRAPAELADDAPSLIAGTRRLTGWSFTLNP